MPTSKSNDNRPEWIEPPPIPPDSGWRELDRNPLVAAILYRRGLRSAADVDAFMHPDRQPVPDPGRIPNMARGVDRIMQAIRDRERIGIFGDYDVDGITATVLLIQALRTALGDDDLVLARLPERQEGYGLNATVIEEFRTAGVSLMIAVDCGSSDLDHARSIAAAGIDLIVVDHHHMAGAGPEPAIMISPQLNGDGTWHDLTAVGVVYLVVCALAGEGVPVVAAPGNIATQYLDLVALGTVADVAPLVGVNRYLVDKGVDLLRSGRRPGVAALVQAAGIEPANVTASSIAYTLAPRLNSAGRIGTPKLSYNLLMSTDRREATQLAQSLEQVNVQRRLRGAQVAAEARTMIEQRPGSNERPVAAAYSEHWEAGLVGAAASRLAEELRRPVFLFRSADGVLSGSARSIDGFNLVDSLAGIADSLIRYGGHSLAAGVSLLPEHLELLEIHLASELARQGIQIPAPRQLRIDATIPAEYLTLETTRDIARMEPFGRGNEQPVLMVRDAQLMRYTVMGQERSHLKIFARAGGRDFETVLWRGADRSRELVGRTTIDLAGRLEVNSWNGQERLQMVIEDFRAS